MVRLERCFKKCPRGKGGHNPVERGGQVTGPHREGGGGTN